MSEQPSNSTLPCTLSAIQRPANALLLANFGALAVILLLWSAWCLGWLPTTAVFNIIVIVPLTLIAGYDIQLARFHKSLGLPQLSPKGRIKAWLYWGIVALFILQVIWKQKGYVTGLLGLLTLVEALCAYVHFLNARQDRKLALMSIGQTLLHAIGWLFYFGMVVHGADRYAGILDGNVNLLGGFPPALQSVFLWCARVPGVGITCILALVLAAASLVLRLYLYAQQGGVSLKTLLNPLGKTAMGCFVLAVTFTVFAMLTLHSQWMDAVNNWSNDTAIFTLASPASQSGAAGKFAEEQKALGEKLISLAHQETDEDAPYAWGRYCRLMDDERLKPWYPPELGADPEDKEALEKYLEALSPSLEQLDALLKSLDTIHDAQIAGGTYLLAEWRFRANAELGRRDDALRALADMTTIARYQANSLDMTQRLRGLHRIVLWTENQKRLPAECHDALQEEAKNLKEFLETLPHGPAIDAFVKENHDKLLDIRAEFRNWGLAMPFFYMMTTADDIRLLQNFQNIDNPAQVTPIQKGQQTVFLFCAFVQNSLTRVYNYELETALGRLEQFE